MLVGHALHLARRRHCVGVVVRRIPGHFGQVAQPAHRSLSSAPAPRITLIVLFGGQAKRVPFMIDSGADFTIIQYHDIASMFRLEGRIISFEPGPDMITVTGIGHATARCRVQQLGLRFRDSSGGLLTITQAVAIAEPPSTSNTQGAVWKLPSLLGRDLLSRFDFNLSYDPPTVSLTLSQ